MSQLMETNLKPDCQREKHVECLHPRSRRGLKGFFNDKLLILWVSGVFACTDT